MFESKLRELNILIFIKNLYLEIIIFINMGNLNWCGSDISTPNSELTAAEDHLYYSRLPISKLIAVFDKHSKDGILDPIQVKNLALEIAMPKTSGFYK